MSERRQLALLFAGAVLLATLGVVAATVFPEPCEEVEGIGTLRLAFVAADAVLPLDPDEAAAVEGAGEQLGIGDFRGAVALPPDTQLLPSDFGFFAVTADDLVALRPGSSRASAARDVETLSVVPVSGSSAGLVTADGTIAVVSSDYERERCGSLPVDADVLAVDRGFALLQSDGGARLWSLSGDEQWQIDVAGGVTAGTLTGDRSLLVLDRGVSLGTLDEPSSEVALPLDRPRPVAVVGDRLLLVEQDVPTVLHDVRPARDDDEAGGLVSTTTTVARPIVAAAPTPAGLVLTTGDVIATDRGASVTLPSALEATAGVASEDGQVGVVLTAGDRDVLLMWGRDLPPDPAD